MNKHVRTKQIHGRKVAYRDLGLGFPIFCIPGFPVSSLVYLPLSLDTNARLMCIDIPHWAGYSDPSGPATVEAYTELVAKFIESFKFKQFGIIGYSYGGIIAQNLLINGISPSKLVLISTFHNGSSILKQRIFRRLLKLYKIRKRIKKSPSRKTTNRALIIAGLLRILTKKGFTQIRTSELFSELLDQVKEINVDRLTECAFSILNKEFIPESYPDTLVIHADKDLVFIIDESKDISIKAKAKLVTIKNANHNSLFFEAKKYSKHINRFFT